MPKEKIEMFSKIFNGNFFSSVFGMKISLKNCIAKNIAFLQLNLNGIVSMFIQFNSGSCLIALINIYYLMIERNCP